jgi:ornithine cyclodeaminase/alanine dehydrogenase-like protein (mu-crystallin family)
MQRADVISCATLADRVIVAGKQLRPGMFVDLIGSFQPHSREADDDAITRSKVVVDTTEALAKSGDLLIPIQGQVWSADRLHGTLADLCNGSAPGRRSVEEIFLFKSVGTALEDLTAAQMIYQRARASR